MVMEGETFEVEIVKITVVVGQQCLCFAERPALTRRTVGINYVE